VAFRSTCSHRFGEHIILTEYTQLEADFFFSSRELAAVRQQGNLNRDEFAVAMKLVSDCVAGRELPQALPLGLVPPNLRTASARTAFPRPPRPFLSDFLFFLRIEACSDCGVNRAESETQQDLFSLIDDDDASPSPVPAVTPQKSPARSPTSQFTPLVHQASSSVLTPTTTSSPAAAPVLRCTQLLYHAHTL
jgi:hypothetical protein